MPTAQGLGRRADAECRGRPGSTPICRRAEQHPRWIHGCQRRRHRGRGAASGRRARAPLFDQCDRAPPCAAPPRSARTLTASRCCADADGDGVAEQRHALLEEPRPAHFGMALLGDTLYVGNTDGVLALLRRARRASPRRAPPRRASSPTATGRGACWPTATGWALSIGDRLAETTSRTMAAGRGKAAPPNR